MYCDWVRSLDRMRLTSTYTFLVNGTTISSSSKNQTNVVYNWLRVKYMGCIQVDKKIYGHLVSSMMWVSVKSCK